MQVRLRPCEIGDVVTVKNCEMYFYLPDGLPNHSQAVVVGRDSGRIIVQAFGQQWNLAMQCVDNGEEYFCNGQWLDENDRRVVKAQAFEARQYLRQLRGGKEKRKRPYAPKRSLSVSSLEGTF